MLNEKEILLFASAIMATVREEGEASESMLHLAMQEFGATPTQCSYMLEALIKAGKLMRSAAHTVSIPDHPLDLGFFRWGAHASYARPVLKLLAMLSTLGASTDLVRRTK